MKILFASKKQVYKANMHCHTTVSDGRYTPQETKEKYMAQGYGIVAFTDHDVLRAHDYLSDDSFLAINACEVAINRKFSKNASWDRLSTYHLNLYATRQDMTVTPPLPKLDYNDTEGINRYIADRVNEGFLVCYNHPYWSLQTFEQYSKLRGCFAMEIYNHNCEVNDGCYGYAPQVYDEMLRNCGNLYCFSTDDNHNAATPESADYDSFGGYICVSSEGLGYSDVIESLKNGNFYSSQGPDFKEIVLDNKTLNIKCSPCKLIAVYTVGRKCYVKTGEDITQASFELSGDEGYVRIMIRDKHGKDANSNAHAIPVLRKQE